MIYMANPCGPKVLQAMVDHRLGFIDTPRQRNLRPEGVIWCADNGAFSKKFDPDTWWSFLVRHAPYADSCLFVALPDVVQDWPATLERSRPWIDKVRDLGYRPAIVLQDGATFDSVPWRQIDAVFVGGSTAWKLGPEARQLVQEARWRGLWVHMGRVNSEKRLRYAQSIGCDSVDGTYLVFGPDINLPKLLGWIDRLDTCTQRPTGSDVPRKELTA